MCSPHDNGVNRLGQFIPNAAGLQALDGAERLFHLFVGSESRHLKLFGPPSRDLKHSGHWKLDVQICEGPATVDDWRGHLAGRFILAVFPQLANETCNFGCIGIVNFDPTHANISERIKRLNLPLTPYADVIGGLRLFAHFSEPIQVKLIKAMLRKLAKRLGLKTFKVFPSDKGADHDLLRAVPMPYGPTWEGHWSGDRIN